MRKSWLMCVLLGALAWGQAPPAMTPASPAQSPSATSKAPAPPSEVPENAVVLEIKGVCAAVPKTTAAPKTGAGKTASVPAKKPADCETEITRAQFEYPQILSAYDTVADWIATAGLSQAGPPREVYGCTDIHAAAATDPVCDIAFPIRGSRSSSTHR